MSEDLISAVDRRRFLTQVIPACSFACLYAGALSGMPTTEEEGVIQGDVHKFDVEFDQKMTSRRQVTEANRYLIKFIQTLQGEMDQEELIRLLNINSAQIGREVGVRHAKSVPDTSFESFVSNFRPPNYQNTLTLEIVEDTPKAFGLRVTECVWATVYRDAGLGGRIGHAALCNMDNTWPGAFNEKFKMVRDKTLMEGHDHCNHRYLDTT
jgi:hypothetical protein